MSNNNSERDIFIPLLTILLIGLKLTGHISWSWLWVLSPLWVGFLVLFLILVFLGIIKGLSS